MEVEFPLLVRIFHKSSWSRNTSELISIFFIRNIHVPHSNYVVSEFYIMLESCTDQLVVALELIQSHWSLIFEIFQSTVKRCKKVEELKSSFLYSFQTSFNIWVSAWLKSGF